MAISQEGVPKISPLPTPVSRPRGHSFSSDISLVRMFFVRFIASLTVPLGIEHLAVVERFTDQRIPLGVSALNVLGAISHEVDGQAEIELVEDFERVAEAGALEAGDHQQIDVGIRPRRAPRVRAEQNDPLRPECAADLPPHRPDVLHAQHDRPRPELPLRQ